MNLHLPLLHPTLHPITRLLCPRRTPKRRIAPTQLHPFPKVVVTPVAAARAHFKKEEQAQTTITQWHRDIEKQQAGKPSPSSSSPEASSDDMAFEPKTKKKKMSPRKNPTTTAKIKKNDQTKAIIASTLIKVDDVVNLKKCKRIKERDRKTKKGTNDNPNNQLHTKKAKVEKKQTNRVVSEEKGDPDIKVVQNRNMFNVGDMVMLTVKQICHPAYEFHYVSPSYLFLIG
jgi:hypothetical protein